ncbi:MAG: cytochrome P450 [Acidimicrobiia bacterium]
MEFNPFSADFFDDPYDTYRWLRDEAPVYHNEHFGFWALSRFDDLVAAHRDWKTFSSQHGVTIDQLTDPNNPQRGSSIIFMDPPEHERMRKLVSRVFTPRAVAALEPLVRRVVAQYLDRLEGRDEIDLVADFAAPFPVEVISTMLGVPEPDRQQVRIWTDEMLHREPDDPKPTPEGMQAGMNQLVYFLELIKTKRSQPADDMISRLIEVEVEDETGNRSRLSDGEIAGFATLLAAAGSETVTKLIGSGLVLFGRNPGEWRKVLDDPERIPNAVEEVLRYWAPSQYQGRFTHTEARFEGGTIPEGVPVLLVTGAANHDERAYDSPDVFDIDRPPKLAIGLGHGIHSCLGAALARLESAIAIDEVRSRWPAYEVDESGLRRVHMSNVAGFSNVPVRVTA